MKKFQWVSAVLMICLVLTAIAGCGTQKQESAETAGTTSAAATAADEKQGFENSKVLELDMWYAVKAAQNYKGNVKEDIVKEAVAKKTGVRITSIVDNGEMTEMEKFNLMFASGEMPAVMKMALGSERAKIVDQLEKADYLHKYTDEELQKMAPDIFKAIVPAAWNIWKRADGKNAALLMQAFGASPEYQKLYPEWTKNYANGNSNDFCAFLVRDDALKTAFPDALSLKEMQDKAAQGPLSLKDFEVPGLNSWKEYVDFLYKVKGKFGNDVVGMGNKEFFDGYMRAFLGGNLYINFDPVTLEGYSLPTQKKDQFIDFFKTCNKMFADGIIDKDFAIQKNEKFLEKRDNGKYIVVAGANAEMDKINGNLEKNNASFRYRIAVISYNTGDNVRDGYYRAEPARVSQGVFLNKKKVSQEDIAKVLNYYNYFATDEGHKMVVWGPEDAGLWEEKDGKRVWKTQEFAQVLTGAKPVGEIKDYDYYGLHHLARVTWRPEFWWPHNHRAPVYYPTVKVAGAKSMPDLLNDAIVADKKGFYQDDHAAWNGSTATNQVFWQQWQAMKDQLSKVVMAPAAEFQKQMDEFYAIYNEKAQFPQYYEEQTRLMMEWLKKNKDTTQFHPNADLSKIK